MSPELFEKIDPFTGDADAPSRDLTPECDALDDSRRRRDGIAILHHGSSHRGGSIMIRPGSTDRNGQRSRRHSEDSGAAMSAATRPLLRARGNSYHHRPATITTARAFGSRRQTCNSFRSPTRYDSDDDSDALSDCLCGIWPNGGDDDPTPVVARRSASAGAKISHVSPRSDVGTDDESALLERLAGLSIDDRRDAEDASSIEPAAGDGLVARARPLRPRRKGIPPHQGAAATADENPFSLYPEIEDIGRPPSPAVVISSAGRRGGFAHTTTAGRGGDDQTRSQTDLDGEYSAYPLGLKRQDRHRRGSSTRSTTDGSEGKRGSGSPAPPKTRKRGRCESSAASLFVCPYVRYNPDKYEKWSSCRRGAWSSTHRVKEHLYRVHQGKPFCPRCGETFEAEDDVRGHLSRPEGVCDRVDRFEVEGFDAAQEKKLHSRKRKRTSEEENWKDIFRILFPGETSVPDPCEHRSEGDLLTLVQWLILWCLDYRSTHSKPDRPVSSDGDSVHSGGNSHQMEAALARVEEIIKQPLDKRQRLEMLAVLGDLGAKRSKQLDGAHASAHAYAAYSTNEGEPEPSFGFSSSPTLPSSSPLDLHSDEAVGDAPLDGTDPYPFMLDSMAASADFWPPEESYLEKFDADAFIQQYQNPYPEYDESSWRVGDGLVGSGYGHDP
ncbi:hypothetical protein CMUS01_07194 [Colletotrichum musicola]|uniref:C2H2-type domain-containing protein n=1 Tax=Colletotrichum musicola TaxID=2175873 RepID=A0A8H6KHP7_9PEZI|nr:hypothetical protein CMUS01_07194 [Colletotrichum musicola]